MHTLFKKIILLFLLSITSLFADGSDIRISVNNAASVYEYSGSMSFTIQLSQSPDWNELMTVNYTTIDSSGQAGSDYSSTSGSVTFIGLLNQMSKTITVSILDDAIHESTEKLYFQISITPTIGYKITKSTAQGLIYDDDLPSLKLDNFSDMGQTETDIDTTLSMIAYFNQNLPSALTLTYHTEDNTAYSGSDYVAVVAGTVNVAAGNNKAIIPITIKGDDLPENTKEFRVVIDSISSGTITDNSARAVIADDDSIQVNISSTDIPEGNVSDNNKMPFRIFLSKAYPLLTPLSINYQAQDGSAPSATENSDYTATNGSVTFNKGEIEKIVYVPIIGDSVIEPDENLKMFISGSSYVINHYSESKILNDDGAYPTLSCNSTNVSIIEGNSGQSTLQYIFTLDSPAVANSSFDYETQDDDEDDKDDDDGDGNPYNSGEHDDSNNDGDDDDDNDGDDGDNDYNPIPKTTYNLNVGDVNITLDVKINGDTKIEKDELFNLQLSNTQNLNLGSCSTINSSIINDDGSYPKLSFDQYHYDSYEGNSSQKDLNFTFTLDQPALAGSSFDYYTSDGSAIANSDYQQISLTTYTFVGGEQNISIPVKINGDTELEGDERFYFNISNEKQLKIGSDKARGEILNDDLPHVIENIGEFRFDDCGAGEWKIDSSTIHNNAQNSSPSIIQNDDKSYMCTSLNGYSSTVNILHNSAYEVPEGTFSMLLYDHHNIWAANSWLFQKGGFKVEVVRVGGDLHKGSVDVYLDGNKISTQEVYFTNSDGGNSDTQWIHVAITFGQKGMKLYINGSEKGSNSYTGGIELNTNNISMATLSGYFDEFYMFKGAMTVSEVQHLYSNLINNKNLDGSLRDCSCGNPNTPFVCDSSMYISSSTNRETLATGKMWLHKIDTTSNPFQFQVLNPTGATQIYNAIAYNHDDDYIYGLYHRELVRLSSTGDITNLGTVTALPNQFNNKQLYAGAIFGGYLYVTGRISKQKKMYQIKLSDKTVSVINFSIKIAIQDFSFSSDGKYLYGVGKQGKLTKIDVANGNVTEIGANHTGYEFDSSFSDKNDRFFANDSNGHGFFEFNLVTGAKSFISNSQPATFNDGANCLNGSLVFNDYSDAPSSYGTPRHNIANGLFLGAEVDHDVQAYTSIDADGDDSHGVDDEDGVTRADGSDINGSYFEPDTVHYITVRASKAGYLNAWLDFNINGIFDSSDKIVNAQALVVGDNNISFTVPAGVTVDTTTYFRFRFSSISTLNATQNANDGEVEDYAVKFGSAIHPLLGTFNIERSNSGSQTINSLARNAWYTQIVGRDFDYSLVFYDENMTQEKILDNVTVKIELLNEVTNKALYTRYAHIVNTPAVSRVDIISGVNAPDDDLATLPATRKVRFRISYGVDAHGGIAQVACATDPQTCFNNFTNTAYNDAQDDFSIRPERFFVQIKDKNTEKINSDYLYNNLLRVASGYDYNLSVIATKFNTHLGATDYNESSVENFEFNTSKITTCDNIVAISQNIDFQNGTFNTETFSHDNVGYYTLMLTEDSNWTEVDKAKGDCLVNDSSTSASSLSLSGCNIALKQHGINLEFYPYKFDIALSQKNLPSSTHPDFIYMSELSQNYHNTAIQFEGEIIAQTQNSTATSNFTSSCMAKDVLLTPVATIKTEDGILVAPNKMMTASNDGNNSREELDFIRMERFNNEDFNISAYHSVPYISNELNITGSKFLDDQNGSVTLDLRYNIQKHLTKTINPIQITFDSLSVISTNAYSEANQSNNHIPVGFKNLNNSIRNFYFAQVAPDLLVYPRVNFAQTKIIQTPLNVDIFCNRPVNYCQDTNVFENTVLSSSPRKQKGWFLSVNHNAQNDGNVTSLNPSPNNATTSSTPIVLTSGRNGVVATTLSNCSAPSVTIVIGSDTALNYHPKGQPPYYKVECIQNADSEWAGIGKAGNIIQTQSNVEIGGKVDW